MQEQIVEKRLRFYVIDAYAVAREAGMGGRINTIMQTCFFAISRRPAARRGDRQIKKAIEKTYGKRGEEVVRRNFAAVDATLAHLHEVAVPGRGDGSTRHRPPVVPPRRRTSCSGSRRVMMAGKGDLLPVSAFPVGRHLADGDRRVGEAEHRAEIPIWDPDVCIQCNKCALVCPHAAIRAKVYEPAALPRRPRGFQSRALQGRRPQGARLHPPGGARGLHRLRPLRRGLPGQGQEQPAAQGDQHGRRSAPLRDGRARRNYAFFLDLPEVGPRAR